MSSWDRLCRHCTRWLETQTQEKIQPRLEDPTIPVLTVLLGTGLGALFWWGGPEALHWGRGLLAGLFILLWTLFIGLADQPEQGSSLRGWRFQTTLFVLIPLLLIGALIGFGGWLQGLVFVATSLWFLVLGRGKYLQGRHEV